MCRNGRARKSAEVAGRAKRVGLADAQMRRDGWRVKCAEMVGRAKRVRMAGRAKCAGLAGRAKSAGLAGAQMRRVGWRVKCAEVVGRANAPGWMARKMRRVGWRANAPGWMAHKCAGMDGAQMRRVGRVQNVSEWLARKMRRDGRGCGSRPSRRVARVKSACAEAAQSCATSRGSSSARPAIRRRGPRRAGCPRAARPCRVSARGGAR